MFSMFRKKVSELDFGMGLCWLIGNVTFALVAHHYMCGAVA